MKLHIAVSYVCFLISGLVLPRSGCGQNLILNGSFEDLNYCEELKKPCSPSAWFYINNNPLGYYKRKELDNYRNYALRFGGFGKDQYWQTILADRLIPGEEYVISFDLSASDTGLGNYGFLFTDSFLFSACDTSLASKNYIPMTDGKEKALKSGWIHVEKHFIADNGFQYLIVGNFGSSSSKRAGFDFDNLRLQPVKHNYHLDDSLKDSIFAIRERHVFHKICHRLVRPDVKPLEKRNSPDSIVIENLRFAFNSYTILNPEVVDRYDSIFDPKKIEKILVFGYTDSVGSEKYNLYLSKMRAEAVRKLLIKKYEFHEGAVEAIGKGVSREYGDIRRNRRVEIKITRKAE